MNEQDKLQQYLHGAKEVLDDQRLESMNAEIPYTWRDVGSERQILIASEQCFCCWTKRIPATRHLTDWNFAQSVQNRQITHRRRRRTLRRRHFHRNEIPQTLKRKKKKKKRQSSTYTTNQNPKLTDNTYVNHFDARNFIARVKNEERLQRDVCSSAP